MFFLVYISSAIKQFSPCELVELLATGDENDTALGVTGMLLYRMATSCRCWRGRTVVRALYSRNGRDPRRGLLTLARGRSAERRFQDWSMGFRNLQAADAQATPGYSEFLDTPLTPQEFHPIRHAVDGRQPQSTPDVAHCRSDRLAETEPMRRWIPCRSARAIDQKSAAQQRHQQDVVFDAVEDACPPLAALDRKAFLLIRLNRRAGRGEDPFVIFGVTGDLAHRLVIPALYNLAANDLLPENFCIVGIARKGMSSEGLTESLTKGLYQFATRKVDDALAKRLLACVTCIEADPKDPASFDRLRDQLDKIEAARKTGGNRLFYLATPPTGFLPISKELGRTGMLTENGAWRRLVVEKPFGTDLASAKALNGELLKLMDEHQIYRIDHYLGKETVQNILVLRFANGMFEPIWNRNHIDHIQITVDEKLGVGHRGNFYDQTGALRDMVPNHLFQLLSLVAMEPPAKFDAHSVRTEKAEVLAAIQTQSEEEALRNSVRGQYRAGKIGDTEIDDYRKTTDVKPGSNTETYAALKLTIDNWRWAGVPFYLRTGKALGVKRTEIAIKFKQAPFAMFRETPVDRLSQNFLIISTEPTEGIALQFNTKVPGPAISIDGVEMKFRYKDYFQAEPSTGYETLIYDCMIGDNILFQRADSVEAGWQAVQPFLDAWKKAGGKGLKIYEPGSEGPEEANDLLERDGKNWRKLT